MEIIERHSKSPWVRVIICWKWVDAFSQNFPISLLIWKLLNICIYPDFEFTKNFGWRRDLILITLLVVDSLFFKYTFSITNFSISFHLFQFVDRFAGDSKMNVWREKNAWGISYLVDKGRSQLIAKDWKEGDMLQRKTFIVKGKKKLHLSQTVSKQDGVIVAVCVKFKWILLQKSSD